MIICLLQGYGVQSGLVFLLSAYLDDLDYLCKGPVQGFKVNGYY